MEVTPEIQALLDDQKAKMTAEFETATTGLRQAKDALLSEKKAEQEAKRALADEAESIRLAKATQDKDVETLSASYEEKLELSRLQLADQISINETLNNGIKQNEINKLASGFVNANVVDNEFIRNQMTKVYAERIDIREGKTVVLDAAGNLTALTVQDLNSEFMGSSLYAEQIRATKASGGGATGNKDAGRASNNTKYLDMTLEQQVEYIKANPPQRTQ